MKTPNDDTGQRWLNLQDTARLLDNRVTRQTVWQWVKHGEAFGQPLETRRDTSSGMVYLSESSVLEIKDTISKLPPRSAARPRRSLFAVPPRA